MMIVGTRRCTSFCWMAVFAFATLVCAAPAAAELSADQQAQVAALESSLVEIAAMINGKKYSEAGEAVADVRQKLAALSADGASDELAARLAPLQKKLAAATRLVEKRNVTKTERGKKPAPKPAASGVSFVKEVGPLLMGRCSNCHVRQARGQFSMTTFAALKKGSASGVVYFEGKSDGSPLIDILKSGDMPRGSGKLSDQQIDLIAKWIDEGAKFDGPSETTPLTEFITTPEMPAVKKLEAIAATGNESVQFVRDLAPIVLENCTGCHGGMRNVSGQLNMDSFNQLLNGGQSGQIVAPGDADASLLVQKLKGMGGGARMPLQRPPLSDEVIEKFATWINEGARYDGGDAGEPIEVAVAVLVANKMSHDELAAHRVELASKNWRLSMPDEAPQTIETENFVLMGNVSKDRLEAVKKMAEAQRLKIAKQLKIPANQPFMKGRMTLFVFNRRFDYSEYGEMVEKRQLPDDLLAHWKYSVVDAYGCVVAPRGDEYDLEPLLAEAIAGAYLDSAARTPKWFSKGVARVIAARAQPKAQIVKDWEESARSAMATLSNPDDFLQSDATTGAPAALSYAFTKFLMTSGKYHALLGDLKKGVPFGQALQKHYGADAKTLATAWAKRA